MRVLIFFILMVAHGCNSSDELRPLRIACAANMQFPLQEMIDSLNGITDFPIQSIISSSGKLTAQIISKAPYDIFISADTLYPYKLFKEDLAEAPILYAKGKLSLWSANHIDLSKPDMDLNTLRIAIANPVLAPYGKAALSCLRHYAPQLDTSRLIYGESVAQLQQFIKTESIDICVTSRTQSSLEALRHVGLWQEIPDDIYLPIQQSLCIIDRPNIHPGCQAFVKFILSSSGRTILEKYGYSTN